MRLQSHKKAPAYRRVAASIITLCVCATAWADVAALSRELDAVESTLNKAIADAEAGRLRPLRTSLKTAQEAWSNFFVGYRGWGAGTDPTWVTDVDAIQTQYMNATNAVTPANNAAQAATHLKQARDLLAGLRDRNAVPDVAQASQDLKASLENVQKSMKSLQEKGFGTSSLGALSQEWTEITEAWTSFNTVLIEANALGLSEGDLAKLKQRVERQSVLFTAVGNALGNSNLTNGLTNLESAMDGLRELAAQWAEQSAEEDPGEPKRLLDPKRKRRLNFR